MDFEKRNDDMFIWINEVVDNCSIRKNWEIGSQMKRNDERGRGFVSDDSCHHDGPDLTVEYKVNSA